ncbi:MAG: hypothetical protein MZV49_15720 [Rhodopseudomonas palustris]|nr:hypothetical protein [Rhodopseudomonas palustris]
MVGGGGAGGAVVLPQQGANCSTPVGCSLTSPKRCPDGRIPPRRASGHQHEKITAQDLMKFGIIDQILPEPRGGAHRDPATMITKTGDAIAKAFDDLRGLDTDEIRAQHDSWKLAASSARNPRRAAVGRAARREIGAALIVAF